jgi:hypothetical protein
VGHLGVGARAAVPTPRCPISARAGLLMLDAPSHPYLAYRSGVPLTAAVWPDLAHDSGFAVGSSR